VFCQAAEPLELDALVRSPDDAKGVCVEVVIGGMLTSLMTRAEKAGEPVRTRAQLLEDLTRLKQWPTVLLPGIQGSCTCVIAKIPGQANDMSGSMTVRGSTQFVLRALRDVNVSGDCMKTLQNSLSVE
jgi:hypothetical protein